MVRTEEEWAEMANKYGYGIDADKATKEELAEFVQTVIYLHETEDLTDNDLWLVFQEQFEGFTVESFRKIRTETRSKLRRHLLRRGVYVGKHNNRVTISELLFEVIQREELHQWTDEEIEATIEELAEPLITRALRKRLNHTLDGLATSPKSAQPTTTATIPPNGLATGPKPTQPTATATIPPGIQILTPMTPRTPTTFAPQQATPTTTQQQQLDPGAGGTASYSKEAAMVAKMYTDSQKYDGVSESFDFKLAIFEDTCRRAGLQLDSYMIAFPTMLKGLAQDHYYNRGLSAKTYTEACTHMRNFFEGPEFYRKNLAEWNATTLQGIIDANTDKSVYQCLQLLIDKLCKQQHGINPEFRTPLFLTNKLVMACQGVPACRIAVSNPGEDLSQLINKLQSSIVAWEKEHPNQGTTFFTDRRYHRDQDRGRAPDRTPSRRGGRRRAGSYSRTNNRLKARCYVCQKEDCRSWKHTDGERARAKETYKSKFNNRTNGRFNNRFEERFKQYVIECEEGSDEDSEAEANDAFENLILDIESELNYEKEPEPGTAYLTAFGELTPNEATSVSIVLANKAFSHSMTLEDMTEPTPATDPFTYTLNTPSSRYTSDVFLGIVVDTGASKKSTAGYGQFRALQRSNPAMELELDTSTKGQVTVQFGIGSTSSIGTANVHTPIGEVQFHIVDASTPFLLCLADMDKLQVYYNNIQDVLVTRTGEVPVVRRFGHAFLLCNSSLHSFLLESFESNPCCLTDVELQRLHRRFGHPSVERLQRVLERSGHDDVDKKTLEHLTKYCHFCQKHGKSPGRFRFTLRDDVEFNYCIIVDIMYISGSPLLHVVDEGTRFQAGRWLQDISAKHTWEVLRMC